MRTYCWPELPRLPSSGEPVLIRVAASPERPVARREARAALRVILASWSGLPPSRVLLEESCIGPLWPNRLAGETLDINFSYGANEAWIGLVRAGRIGVDVMRVEPFAESQAVARAYLGPEAAAAIALAPDPDRAFAAAWTEREARLKCAKRGLTEWDGSDTPEAFHTGFEGPDWVGAVAVRSRTLARHCRTECLLSEHLKSAFG